MPGGVVEKEIVARFPDVGNEANRRVSGRSRATAATTPIASFCVHASYLGEAILDWLCQARVYDLNTSHLLPRNISTV